jgi:hypothetical protein
MEKVMATFKDPISGETRELNFNGIKCKPPEPDPMANYVRELGDSRGACSIGFFDPDPLFANLNRPYTPGTFDLSGEDVVMFGGGNGFFSTKENLWSNAAPYHGEPGEVYVLLKTGAFATFTDCADTFREWTGVAVRVEPGCSVTFEQSKDGGTLDLYTGEQVAALLAAARK